MINRIIAINSIIEVKNNYKPYDRLKKGVITLIFITFDDFLWNKHFCF